MSSSFVFQCYGDRAHGFGHIVRDIVLGRELRARGHDVRFITAADTPGLARIQAAGFPWRTAGQWYSDDVLPYAGDVIILDLEHGPSLAQLQEARAVYSKVVNIGGVGFAIDNPAAIAELVDLEIYGGELFARQSTPRLLAGPDYLIIDPAYRDLKPDHGFGHIVVAMGGADPHNLTGPAAWALHNCGRKVVAITGPASTVDIRVSGVNVVKAPLSLLSHLDGAALCVTATGMTAYEALAAGVPCLLTNWSGDHLATAQELERRGAAVNLGVWQDFDPGELADLAHGLSERHLATMGAAGREIVDGRGTARVADELERLAEREGAAA